MNPDRSESRGRFSFKDGQLDPPAKKLLDPSPVFDAAAVDQANLFTAPEAQHILNMQRF
jgi:hypothetical protein